MGTNQTAETGTLRLAAQMLFSRSDFPEAFDAFAVLGDLKHQRECVKSLLAQPLNVMQRTRGIMYAARCAAILGDAELLEQCAQKALETGECYWFIRARKLFDSETPSFISYHAAPSAPLVAEKLIELFLSKTNPESEEYEHVSVAFGILVESGEVGAEILQRNLEGYLRKPLGASQAKQVVEMAISAGVREHVSTCMYELLKTGNFEAAQQAKQFLKVRIPKARVRELMALARTKLRKGDLRFAVRTAEFLKGKLRREDLIACSNLLLRKGVLDIAKSAAQRAKKTLSDAQMIVYAKALLRRLKSDRKYKTAAAALEICSKHGSEKDVRFAQRCIIDVGDSLFVDQRTTIQAEGYLGLADFSAVDFFALVNAGERLTSIGDFCLDEAVRTGKHNVRTLLDIAARAFYFAEAKSRLRDLAMYAIAMNAEEFGLRLLGVGEYKPMDSNHADDLASRRWSR